MPRHIQLSFTDIQPEQQDVLIAHLSEVGFEGFEELDHGLNAFIPENLYDRKLVHELLYKFQLKYNESTIPEQNWNHLWESNFQPVLIGDFVAIRANFHEPISNVEHEIVITPKMSFGTGHHATTLMMVEQMREFPFTNKQVFDFGTGTGILAMLAERLGAASIIAIDNDNWSIANARENIHNNNCQRIDIRQEDEVCEGPYDIILANINKNIILDNLAQLTGQLRPQGILLISGLLKEDENEVLEATRNFSLTLNGKSVKGNWICLRLTR